MNRAQAVGHVPVQRTLWAVEVGTLQARVRATPLGDPATWQALASRWGRFAATLHHHHTAEDTHYWPALRTAVEARGTADDLVEVQAMA